MHKIKKEVSLVEFELHITLPRFWIVVITAPKSGVFTPKAINNLCFSGCDRYV